MFLEKNDGIEFEWGYIVLLLIEMELAWKLLI
jgi:hypothetical protein